MAQHETQTGYEAGVQAAVARLQQHLDEPPGFRELASGDCLSPYHFHRIFRALVGESPAELTRRLRLERAAWWLRTTNRPVTEIALGSGYATHEAFTKAFHAAFRCSPTRFRGSERDCDGIPSVCSVHFTGGRFTPLRFVYQPKKASQTMTLETIELPERRIAAVTHTGPYHEIGAAFGRLAGIAGPLGLYSQTDPHPHQVGIYVDDPDSVPAAELRSVAGVYVPEGVDIGALDDVRQAAGKFLKAEYIGHYSALGQAWATLYGELIPAGGYTLRDGPCYEVYVSADHTAPPEQLRTHLYVPIE